MSDGFLTTQELAEKYALPDMSNAERAWYRLCMRWRDQGKLRINEHWCFSLERGCRTRRYKETCLLKLVCNSERPFCREVQSVYRDAILLLMQGETRTSPNSLPDTKE